MYFCSSKNGPDIRTRLVTPQEENIHTGSTTAAERFCSCLDARPPEGRESAGRFTLVCTHAHAPTSRSGAETVKGDAPPNPTLIQSTSILLLLLLCVAATDAIGLLLLLRLINPGVWGVPSDLLVSERRNAIPYKIWPAKRRIMR